MVQDTLALSGSNSDQGEHNISIQLVMQKLPSKYDIKFRNDIRIYQKSKIQKNEVNNLSASDRLYYNAKFFTQYPPKITKENIEAFLNSEYLYDEFVQQRNLITSDNEASLSIDDQINHIVHDIYQSMNNQKYESKKIRIDAYRKRYASNWSKQYEIKMIDDFKRRVGRWDGDCVKAINLFKKSILFDTMKKSILLFCFPG